MKILWIFTLFMLLMLGNNLLINLDIWSVIFVPSTVTFNMATSTTTMPAAIMPT
ncbi:hypothetical protein ABHN03_06865 [Paenibacillus sp. NRS-1775]